MMGPRESPRRPEKHELPAPRKRFGQHFLRDNHVLDSIVDAIGPIADRMVVEIAPGRDALTDRLAERAGREVAIEVDRDLAGHLRTRYADRSNVDSAPSKTSSASNSPR